MKPSTATELLRTIDPRVWTIDVSGTLLRVATDRVRMLCMAVDDDGADIDEPAHRKFHDLIARAPRPTHAVGMTRLLGAIGGGSLVCQDCRGSGFAADSHECADCGGDGEVTCNLGHAHDCESCGGTGTIGVPCTGPGPHFRTDDIQPVQFGGIDIAINAQRIRGLLPRLPGETIHLARTADDVLFLFGAGWTLAVAGLAQGVGPILRIGADPLPQTTAAATP